MTSAPQQRAVRTPAKTRILTPTVKAGQPVRLSLSGYRPGSVVVVSETFSVRQGSRLVTRTVALARLLVSADGTLLGAATPVRSANTGAMTIIGVDGHGNPVRTTARIRVVHVS